MYRMNVSRGEEGKEGEQPPRKWLHLLLNCEKPQEKQRKCVLDRENRADICTEEEEE